MSDLKPNTTCIRLRVASLCKHVHISTWFFSPLGPYIPAPHPSSIIVVVALVHFAIVQMGSSKTRRILRFVTEHKDYTLNLRHYLDIKSLVQLAQIFDLDERSGCFVMDSRIATVPNNAGLPHRYTLLSKPNCPSHLYQNRLLDFYLHSRLRCGSRSSTGLS